MKSVFAAVVFVMTTAVGYAQESTDVSKHDQLQVAVQKICPVSGEELGSMGVPVKVKVGEQIAFLCCKGCQSEKIDATHWNTIQTRIAKAQGTCPIMGHAIDSSMKFAMVNGHKIFVCCPPCIEKIEAEPSASLAKVAASYQRFLTAEQRANSDRLHAQAQGICPVSGEKLGSKGAPVKVKVGKEEHAFLCCKDCIGEKLSSDHWKTIQNNLANAQGICPVMKQPVDASMKSTVVNGRKIFVCCPPCIKKIKADADGYVAKLDAQIARVNEERSRITSK